MPNYQGVWNISTHFQNTSGWPSPPPVGLFNGGRLTGGTATNTVQRTNIVNEGNTTDWGDLVTARYGAAAAGSSTRGIFAGGEETVNEIQYVSFAAAGNYADFGDLNVAHGYTSGCSNQTYMLVMGDINDGASRGVVDVITMATLGNGANFGSLITDCYQTTSVSSTTRAVVSNGQTWTGGVRVNSMEYTSFGTSGSFTDFGDLTVTRDTAGGASSNTRGLFMGGNPSGFSNVIDYITIASTGNANDFGDLTQAVRHHDAVSNKIRAVRGGGSISGTNGVVDMDYVAIASTGNASDFGDLLAGNYGLSANSNAHGGLQ